MSNEDEEKDKILNPLQKLYKIFEEGGRDALQAYFEEQEEKNRMVQGKGEGPRNY